MRDALHSASTGAKGQLDPARSGLLILGALRLSEQVIAELDHAIQRKFRRDRATKGHITGVAIVSLAHEADTTTEQFPLLTTLGVTHPRPAIWNAQIRFRFSANPSYTGKLHIRNDG